MTEKRVVPRTIGTLFRLTIVGYARHSLSAMRPDYVRGLTLWLDTYIQPLSCESALAASFERQHFALARTGRYYRRLAALRGWRAFVLAEAIGVLPLAPMGRRLWRYPLGRNSNVQSAQLTPEVSIYRATSEILECIEAVAAGHSYISPILSDFLLRRRATSLNRTVSNGQIERLTPAERRILELIAQDKTSKEIADELGISPRTVENHRTKICDKLNVHGIHSLVKFAYENHAAL